MRAWLLLVLLSWAGAPASAQTLPLPAGLSGDDAAVAKAMPGFANEVIAAYRDEDRDRYLATLFRLQMVAGRNEEAIGTIAALRTLRTEKGSTRDATVYLQYEIVADARLRERKSGLAFPDAFAQAFRDRCKALDDNTARQAQFSFGGNLPRMQQDWRDALASQRGKREIAMADALDLVRKYQVSDVFTAMLPLAEAAMAQDDARRYDIAADVLVPTSDDAHIAAIVVRPKSATGKLTTLLGFTIYANDQWSMADAKTAAAHGYAGVVAYSRGKGRSPDVIVPYEHDGDDARAVIEWISQQPWSDGRVGMYGGSYNTFAQWAAAKRLPPALKALMTSASTAPGIDVPMQGNVFLNFIYPWPFYVVNNRSLDDATYGDAARWDALNRAWYRQGTAYRELDRIDGTPNPVIRRWLDHPGYDAYWQAMIPYREEFAAIDIPVLATTGYFDGAMVGALYYFNEHTHYRPNADHTLLIGPYEHFTMQAGISQVVQGYAIDPVANIDLPELRFQWFGHVFKGAPKPVLLQDRVNYQVMGGNEWKHAPSLAAMANGKMRFYLQRGDAAANNVLAASKPASAATIDQRVDFSDRSDAAYTPPSLSLTKGVDDHNGLVFASDPVAARTEISGLLSGSLGFVTNKRDMDITVTLYEQMANGDAFVLTSYLGRASYARDRNRRQLLVPDKRQRWDFVSERVTSRVISPGSRLVIVLTINKQADLQLNLGSGKAVSDETIADAGKPMQVQWRNDSYVDIPVWK